MDAVTNNEKLSLLLETLEEVIKTPVNDVRTTEKSLGKMYDMIRQFTETNQATMHGTTHVAISTIPDGEGDKDFRFYSAGDPFLVAQMLFRAMENNSNFARMMTMTFEGWKLLKG